MNCKIPIFEYFNFLPSWKSAQSWLLRLGLYKLTRVKEKANDWIVILDFKVQAGFQKCLIVLGIRWSELVIQQKTRGSFTVNHEDFEPLALVPMTSSSGEKVAQVLEEVSLKTGPFMQTLADHGGDVKKALEMYCEKHTETVNTYDIVHKVANLLKKELENDETWKTIIQLITNTKQKTKQSPEACLSPPKQRDKARFMNADILIDWLQDVLWFLHNGKEVPYLDKDRLRDKIGWVLQYKDTIEEYVIMIEVIRFARDLIRTEGLYKYSHVDFFYKMKEEYADFFHNRKKVKNKNGKRSIHLAKKIFDFLKQEGRRVPRGKRMLGSSEGIESLIGREKIIIERTKATNSITKGVLAIPAMVGECNQDCIEEALKNVSIKDLKDWEEAFIGKSDLSKRKEMFSNKKKCEKVFIDKPNSSKEIKIFSNYVDSESLSDLSVEFG
jgi:hypothetical protein